MEIKITFRFNITLFRMTKFKKTKDKIYQQGCGEQESHTVDGGINLCSQYENWCGSFSKKLGID